MSKFQHVTNTPWRHYVEKYVRLIEKYVLTLKFKYVMRSKICHDVTKNIITSKLHNDIGSMLKIGDDFKVCHDV